MSCCIENEGAKLKVTLTFGREQLLYDIKNNAYVESHVMARKPSTPSTWWLTLARRAMWTG